jgi:hypothetical protein
MKRFLLFTIALALLSCNKEQFTYVPGPYDADFASAKFNTENLELESKMYKSLLNDSLYRLSIDHLDERGKLLKSMDFEFFRSTTDKQIVQFMEFDNKVDPQFSYYKMQGNDLVEKVYQVLETDSIEDYIQLTEFNVATGKVKGHFQVSLALAPSFVSPNEPLDTVVITDGYFETTIR